MASRYISKRYGDNASMVNRSASMTRDARARSRSQSKDPGYYSRCRSSSPARTSGQSQFSSNLQYYRPNESIHERDMLFSSFLGGGSSGNSSMYSSGNMTNMKEQFSSMVQDRWSRKQKEDPSVDHDFARKASAWSNYLSRGSQAASEVLGRKHSAARLEKTSFNLPKIYVYHNNGC